MLIISVLVILSGTKRRSALLLVLIPSCVLQRQWASAPALTQQQRNVYLLQFRSWVACRNYDTFLCHRLSRSQTHVDIHPMCSFTATYRDVDTHSHSLPLCFTHVNKTWHLWAVKACPICMLIHLLLGMTCLLGLTLPPCVTECMCGSRTVTWRWIIHSLLQRYRGPLPTKSASVHVFVLRVCVAGWAHLSIFPSAVLSIIPSIWQPKPVKKTFLLASVF